MTKKAPAKAAKSPARSSGSSKGKAAGAAAAGMAGKWLTDAMKDPEFRAKVIAQSKEAAEFVKQKQIEHKAGKAAKATEKPQKAVDGDLEFLDAIKKRPRRVHKLRQAINDAVERDADLAEAAKPFLQRLKKLDARIATAQGMTKTLRKAEYKVIDARLDQFEVDLVTDFFEPMLPTGD